MKASIVIDTQELRDLVIKALREKIHADFNEKQVKILVKSRQNYRQGEWEEGFFQAIYEADI